MNDLTPETLGDAWDRGADFAVCHPGMSAEYIRAANPFRSSEPAHTREARDNARAYPETARAQNEGADSVARRWMRPSSALDGADLR